MEFKLNKIDTDIRRKLQEKTRDDKVQRNDDVRLKKDIKEYDDKNERYSENYTNEKSEKKFFAVDAIKKNEKNIVIEAEKLEELNEEKSKGVSIDTKR